jgi:demethylmenaquinone methyltransferase/2-methoxy-6-polyprenyl-1,4-benzoquinol methylase
VTEDKKALFVRRLFSRVPAEYDWLLDILSLHQDRQWRDKLVQAADSSNVNLVLDVATGTGLVASRLAKKIGNNGLVVGVDLTLPMLRTAKATLDSKGQSRSTDWILARAENLPFRADVFGATTISLALRNVSDAQKTISEMSRVTVSNGLVASLDFARPLHTVQRFLYYPYILAFFPLIGRLVSKAWYDTFRYLGPSILRARTGRQVVNIMKQEGVSDARSVPLTGGIVCLVYGRKR